MYGFVHVYIYIASAQFQPTEKIIYELKCSYDSGASWADAHYEKRILGEIWFSLLNIKINHIHEILDIEVA